LNCCHVCKTYAFHDALQAGKQKEVRRRQPAPADLEFKSYVFHLLVNLSFVFFKAFRLCIVSPKEFYYYYYYYYYYHYYYYKPPI
jgi:hypothetical protein